MGYPMKKTKDEVLEILSNEKSISGVLENFNSLPEEVSKDGIDYKLSMVVTKIDENKTNYEFNYYSKGTAKFLLEYKIFTNIADSISYLKNGLNG